MNTTFKQQIEAIQAVRSAFLLLPPKPTGSELIIVLDQLQQFDAALNDAASSIYALQLLEEPNGKPIEEEEYKTVELQRAVGRPLVPLIPVLHIEGLKLKTDLSHDCPQLYSLLLQISKKKRVKLSQNPQASKLGGTEWKYRLEIGPTDVHLGPTFKDLLDWALQLNVIKPQTL